MVRHIALNFFAGSGFLVEDAQFFTTRNGRPKVTFRMVSPRDPRLPKKQPNGDYYTVVGLGDHFVTMVDRLRQGTQVVVVGCVQSRDVVVDGDARTVNEILASAVYIVEPASEATEVENGG